MALKGSNLTVVDEIAVPGSVANLGGGFDTLGVAVGLYLRVRLLEVQDDGGCRLVVSRSHPPVSGENRLERAFALAVHATGRRTPSVCVEVESEIPMAAGLGSSAAATVAGLRVFERVTDPLPDDVLLGLATEAEGHADNAAPALVGGLTSVVEGGRGPVAIRWTWPEGLRLIVAIPDAGLATATARAALPEMLPRADAVFNLQRVLSLVHALQSGEDDRLRDAVGDRWHQPARAALVPMLGDVLALEDPDVLGSFLCGAGPSTAILARQGIPRLEGLVRSLYERGGCPATVRTLAVHQGSAVMAGAGASAPGRTR